MMEGTERESAPGSDYVLEKREGGGSRARGAGSKAKRPLNQSESGAGEGQGKRVRTAPKLFGDD